MKNNKGITILSILIIIVIILVCLFLCKIFIKTDKKENITLEEVKELIDSSNKQTNYYCEYEDGSETAKKRNGDNVILTSKKSDSTIWKNFSTGEKIGFNDEKKIAIKLKEQDNTDNINRSIYEEIINKVKDYKYIGEESFNGYNCIVILINIEKEKDGGWLSSFSSENERSDANINIWIDKETGFIMKIKENETEDEIVYKYEFNCVTEDDVKKPDLTGYQIIEQ